MRTPAGLIAKKSVFGPRTRMIGAPLLLTFRRCGQAASNSSRFVKGIW